MKIISILFVATLSVFFYKYYFNNNIVDNKIIYNQPVDNVIDDNLKIENKKTITDNKVSERIISEKKLKEVITPPVKKQKELENNNEDILDKDIKSNIVTKSKKTNNTVSAPNHTLKNEQEINNNIFSSSTRSVVFIDSFSKIFDLHTFSAVDVKSGSGTGIVWDDKGHIITNFHVVAKSKEFSVTLHDNTSWNAKLIGSSPHKDIAVLKIYAPLEKITPIKIGSSNNLKIGDVVFAIGNPFGLDKTMTKGIVSGLGREIASVTGTTIFDVIQTDAAINPGNSGGPLIDINGNIIGVNTAILSPSGANAGIGFAVPIDILKSIVPKIIFSNDDYYRAGLGITPLGDRLSKAINILGVIVKQVEEGGAMRAGIKPIEQIAPNKLRMDVIKKINNIEINNFIDLQRALFDKSVGDQIDIEISRIIINGKLKIIDKNDLYLKVKLGRL